MPVRKDLQIRPPIRSPSPNRSAYPEPAPGNPRMPIPPPKPRRPVGMDRHDFRLDIGGNEKDSMYFVLSPTGESIPQDVPQGTYEEMGYDERELNRNPPPVWKPSDEPQTTLHATFSSSSIIYSRVEAGRITSRRTRGMNYETSKLSDTGSTEGTRKSPNSLPMEKQGAQPLPPRPKATIPPLGSNEQNPMKSIMNDPALIGKLHDKRQELYGSVDQRNASVSSCGSMNPMENYEEVCFDLVGTQPISNSDEEKSPSGFSRVSNMTLPPRRHNIGSEIAMMQCPPDALKAQEYLSFQPSPSHSPQGSTSDLSRRDSQANTQSLSPQLQRKSLHPPDDVPELPPRGAARMRRGSPQLVRKPISQMIHQHTTPAEPLVVPNVYSKRTLGQEKSLSQEDLHQLPTQKSRGLPPRPLSSSFDSPPPVPVRKSGGIESPKPPVRDRMPLSSKAAVPNPPLRHRYMSSDPPPRNHHMPSSQPSSPPPVPIRQSNASGASLSTGELRRFPPQIETVEDSCDAPPVPSRGTREKHCASSNSTPSLQRPHSTPETSNRPKATPKPPIRPTHVSEIDVKTPSCAWNDRASNNQLAISGSATSRPTARPRPAPKPAVSAKLAISTKPPISTKPVVSPRPPVAKPVANKPAKPPVSTRPNKHLPQDVSTSRPPVTPRTDKTTLSNTHRTTSYPNGEIPPPLPPR